MCRQESMFMELKSHRDPHADHGAEQAAEVANLAEPPSKSHLLESKFSSSAQLRQKARLEIKSRLEAPIMEKPIDPGGIHSQKPNRLKFHDLVQVH